MENLEKLLKGDRKTLAQTITLVENQDSQTKDIIKELYKYTSNSCIIGITGSPGSGKSTLVDKLIAHYRAKSKTIGVIAVDPTSPFTGGALLGDRIRMSTRNRDKNVFIRSMGTRGSLGGLSSSTRDAVDVLDASGKDIILIETVGTGQSEVEIIKTADVVTVVLVPGMGDEIQELKSGIMEIADIFVVNKADREDTERMITELNAILQLSSNPARKTPIVKTIANKSQGIVELVGAIDTQISYLKSSDQLERRRGERAKARIIDILKARLIEFVISENKTENRFNHLISKITAKEIDPYTAVDMILNERDKF